MPIDTWFPLGIYYADLDDSSDHKVSFVNRIKDLRQTATINRTTEEFSWTGDVHKVDMIHADPVFDWLNQHVGTHALEYLESFGHDLSMCDLYFQRSWPVIGKKGQSVNRHAHHTAHLSAVYYVSVPSEGDAGEIRFFNDAKPNELYEGISSSLTGGYKTYNNLNYQSALYTPIEGRLLIFPSKLTHEVEENETDGERISISYDLVITATEKPINKSPEFLMPALSKWRKFDQTGSEVANVPSNVAVSVIPDLPVPVMQDLPTPMSFNPMAHENA